MKYLIIREEKNPPDSRVPMSPKQVKSLIDKSYNIEVQRSKGRCFSDQEYEALGVPMVDEIGDQDILLGVKEVPVDRILPGKTYFMFSHTIKEQPYNQKLLRRILDQGSSLIDYEVLTADNGSRVIAFGKFAGMVGAHNALHTYGKRTGKFDLARMKDMDDYEAVKTLYNEHDFPAVKIVLTGTGRVSNGAALVLEDMGIKKVGPLSFVSDKHTTPVYTQLNSFFYVKRKDGKTFDNAQDFYQNPSEYESDFRHFLPVADIMINGIYWDPKAPAFFTKEQMQEDNFNIEVIADVTCDIAPEASIPSTLKASTIPDPIFGYEKATGKEVAAHAEGTVDMMTIDNLPNELPKDASVAFGEMFIEHVLPELSKESSELINRASIVSKGKLGKHFQHLKEYAGE